MEVNEDHSRIVYCWTTNRGRHKEQVKAGVADESDFYSYCARKIRNLMKVFPCAEIALDAQGHKINPLGRSIDSFLGQMMGRPAIPQYGDRKSKISDQNRLIEAGITPDMGMDDVMSTGDDNIDINYGIDSSTGYDDVNMDVDALNQALMGPNVDIGIGSGSTKPSLMGVPNPRKPKQVTQVTKVVGGWLH